jgi:hypothetical protein
MLSAIAYKDTKESGATSLNMEFGMRFRARLCDEYAAEGRWLAFKWCDLGGL